MGRKELEKVAKELNEEAYYHWIVERDKKLASRLKPFSQKRLKKIFFFWLHMTGMHLLEKQEEREIDGDYYTFYKCKVCGYTCSELAFPWEFKKCILIFAILLASLFLPVPDFLRTTKFFLFWFFFVAHLLNLAWWITS